MILIEWTVILSIVSRCDQQKKLTNRGRMHKKFSSWLIHPPPTTLGNFPLAEWLLLLLNCFYHYFVHNYFQGPLFYDNMGQRRQICFRENYPVTIIYIFFFLWKAGGAVEIQKEIVDRQEDSYFTVNHTKE